MIGINDMDASQTVACSIVDEFILWHVRSSASRTRQSTAALWSVSVSVFFEARARTRGLRWSRHSIRAGNWPLPCKPLVLYSCVRNQMFPLARKRLPTMPVCHCQSQTADLVGRSLLSVVAVLHMHPFDIIDFVLVEDWRVFRAHLR